MSRQPTKSVQIQLTENEFENIKNAAKSYGMSAQSYVYNCAIQLTTHRINQLRKEKESQRPSLIIVPNGKTKNDR